MVLNSAPSPADAGGMTRYCSGCNGEVEVQDGACLLGHPVSHAAPTGSLDELRAEVDKVFSAAEAAVSQVLTASDVARSAGLVTAEPSGPVVPAAPPPPPPSGSTEGRRAHDVYAAVATVSQSDDPIEAFAPPPRIDWGPERFSLRRKRRAEAV